MKCYKKQCMLYNYYYHYPMYRCPYYYRPFNNPQNPSNVSGCSGANGTYKGTCDSKEHKIYDCWFPLSYFVEIWNWGTCPVTCYIYYTDGFYKKRESRTIQPNQYHKFDLVDSVLTVTLECDPIGEGCSNCSDSNFENICNVDYWVH